MRSAHDRSAPPPSAVMRRPDRWRDGMARCRVGDRSPRPSRGDAAPSHRSGAFASRAAPPAQPRLNIVRFVLRNAGRTRELQSLPRTASQGGLPRVSIEARS